MMPNLFAYHPEIVVGDDERFAIVGALDDYFTDSEILSGIDSNAKSVNDVVAVMKTAGAINFNGHGTLRLATTGKPPRYSLDHNIR